MKLEELKKILTELDDIQAEANKRLEGLNKRIAELKEQDDEKLKAQDDEKPKPPHPRFGPKDGHHSWYYIENTGDVIDTQFYLVLRRRYEIGNVFRTEEAAEFAVERLKVLAEMREWAGKWNDPYAIAYVVSYYESRIIVNDRLNNLSYAEMRFATIEDAENCIKAVGEERLKKYYFMIPEDETNE